MQLEETTRGAQRLVYSVDTPSWQEKVLVISSRNFFSKHLSPIYQRVVFTTSCQWKFGSLHFARESKFMHACVEEINWSFKKTTM